jgi:hypothetical protein
MLGSLIVPASNPIFIGLGTKYLAQDVSGFVPQILLKRCREKEPCPWDFILTTHLEPLFPYLCSRLRVSYLEKKMTLKNQLRRLDMVVHSCNPSCPRDREDDSLRTAWAKS